MKKLTEGKPIKVILTFMVPLLIGQIFQLLYNCSKRILMV